MIIMECTTRRSFEAASDALPLVADRGRPTVAATFRLVLPFQQACQQHGHPVR